MKLRRKALAIMLLTVTLLIVETRDAAAQDAPPDLHMLMNLDLFASHSNDHNGASAPAAEQPADDSMLEQIRALNAMGYLGDKADAAGQFTPSSRPTYGVEDQQQ